jgi:hypothetical protein
MNEPSRTSGKPQIKGLVQSNPVVPKDDYEAVYITRFVGSPLEVAIANWYYDRSFDVYNIQIPEGNPYFPWFAHASKYYPSIDKTIVKPIGYVGGDDPDAVARRKREAEFVDGGEAGDLWIIALKSETPLVYEGTLNTLMRMSGKAIWKVEETETFRPGKV